jgi:integrase
LHQQFRGRLLSEGRLDGGGGLSVKTVRDILGILKGIFKRSKIPLSIDFQQASPKNECKEMRALDKTEREILKKQLIKNADEISIGVLLAMCSGVRIGELCALRWENIDLENKNLHIKNTLQRIPDLFAACAKTHVVVGSPKTRASVRTISLPDFLVDILTAKAKNPQAYFLSGAKDRFIEPRLVQYHFKKILKSCGIADANFHALRHTYATRCIELGFDAKTLSELLGHSNVNITLNRYVHSSQDLKREWMSKFIL